MTLFVNGQGQSSVQNFTVPANARFTEDLASTVQQVFHAGTNSSANSFSMTVQMLNGAVFVAKRPSYFNTNGVSGFAVQGGNNCIGYVGGYIVLASKRQMDERGSQEVLSCLIS